MKTRLLRAVFAITGIFCICSALIAKTSAFTVYPGAVRNEVETQKANFGKPVNLPASVVYLTTDSFDKVKAYYQGIGKEYTFPKQKKDAVPVPKTAIFIFDNAGNPDASRQWAQISEPLVTKTRVKKWFKTTDIYTTNTAIILNEKAGK